MSASLHVLKSPMGVNDAEHFEIECGITIDQMFKNLSAAYESGADDYGIMVSVDGDVIDQSEWAAFVIAEAANVVVAPRPEGLELLVYAIVAVVAAYAATALIDIPDQPAALPDASPTYSLDAQGNRARLGNPIPDRYGSFRIYPDFASEPYREYIGNDQFLYQLFSIGQGSYEYYSLKIGDTPIENFAEVEWDFYEPGERVTLFTTDVNTVSEVGGNGIRMYAPNEENYDPEIGPFTVNDVGTICNEIAVDITFPRGLHIMDKKGRMQNASVHVLFEYRSVHTSGTVGGWETLVNEVFSYSTVDALRFTRRVSVAAHNGTYEVRARRVNGTRVDDFKLNDEVVWSGLRGYLVSDQTFDHAVWAVKCRATDQLTAQSERAFNLIALRKLPMWNGQQWVFGATRNPVWAFCNILRAPYGGNYSQQNLDLEHLRALAYELDLRGDYFDGQFDRKMVLWQALKQVCASCRSVPYQYGEQFSMIRDNGNPQAVYMFNNRNIVQDSMSVTYQTMDVWGDDSIEVEYYDPVHWKPEHIVCSVPGSTAQRPRKVQLFGVTSRAQAMREGYFLAAKMAYRTIIAEWESELDGRVPQYLDGVVVASEVMEWGSGGEVYARDNDILTLSQPAKVQPFTTNSIHLRDTYGRVVGPIGVTAVANEPNKVRVINPSLIPEWVYTGNAKERTYFAFGTFWSQTKKMLIEKVEHAGGMKTKIQAVLDDPRVHSFDAQIGNGDIIIGTPSPPRPPVNLTITSVYIIHGGTVSHPEIQLSWNIVEGAKSYFVDISYDGGQSWERKAHVESPMASFAVQPGRVDIRIAAQGEMTIGGWFQTHIMAGESFSTPPTVTGLQLSDPFTGPEAVFEWDEHIVAVRWWVQFVDTYGNVCIEKGTDVPNISLHYTEARQNGIGREFTINVFAVNDNDVMSANPADLTVKNPQVQAPTNIITMFSLQTLHVKFEIPDHEDYAGFYVFVSKTNEFDIEDADVARYSKFDPLANYIDVPVDSLGDWFVRVACFDVWGELDELNTSHIVTDIAYGIRNSNLAQEVRDAMAEGGLWIKKVANIGGTNTAYIGIEAPESPDDPSMLILGADQIAFGDENLQVFPFIISGNQIYMNSAMIANLDASKITTGQLGANRIDTRGLEIKDASGNIIFSAGRTLDWSRVGGSGKPQNNADVTAWNTAAGIVNQSGFATLSKLYSWNASTYIEAGAIGSAMIGSVNLVGQSVFQVRTANFGERMDMDSRRIKSIDAGNIVRAQFGNLNA